MLMEMYMKGNEKRIKPMAKGNMFTSMALLMREIGLMINNKDTELKNELMEHYTKEITKKD